MVQESRSLIHGNVVGCKNGGTGDEPVACGASFGDRVTGLAWASVRKAGQCGRRPPQRPNGGANYSRRQSKCVGEDVPVHGYTEYA
ncbi:hypothetical protein HPB47_009076 [Ixodes persulcatus]|uniref:Uncharacterized protein n=1 Tax=Ixodes persulcatus TaxID=34615 RepID=A0AC60P327_IXOPE|nr:hypothetical protein HPB47_009076 [Ixodes persulcatus]